MTKERGTGKECMTMITILGGNKSSVCFPQSTWISET